MIIRRRRKSNPNWDEIHQLLKQGAARQDRTDQQLDRTDRQLEHLSQEQTRLARKQEERDRAWWAKYNALLAAWKEQRAQDQAAGEEKRAQDQAAWEKKHARDQAAWEKKRVQEQTMLEKKLAQEQTMLEKKLAQEQTMLEKKLAQEQTMLEKKHARDQAAWEKKRARDRAAWEEQHKKAVATHEAIARRIQQEIGGAAHNLGNIAEEYFMQAWDKCKPVLIGEVEFDEVLAHEEYRAHGKEMECDLVLLNGTHIGIVEVKLFLHPSDVKAFDAKLRKVLPLVLPLEYRHLQVMPVMACIGMTERVHKRIEEYGFALLRPYGQKARLEIEHLRPRPPVGEVPGT